MAPRAPVRKHELSAHVASHFCHKAIEYDHPLRALIPNRAKNTLVQVSPKKSPGI